MRCCVVRALCDIFSCTVRGRMCCAGSSGNFEAGLNKVLYFSLLLLHDRFLGMGLLQGIKELGNCLGHQSEVAYRKRVSEEREIVAE